MCVCVCVCACVCVCVLEGKGMREEVTHTCGHLVQGDGRVVMPQAETGIFRAGPTFAHEAAT